jgi:hypothetical protein
LIIRNSFHAQTFEIKLPEFPFTLLK